MTDDTTTEVDCTATGCTDTPVNPLKEIAAKVDVWSYDYIAKRSRLLGKILPRVRDMARGAKRRLGNDELPSGTFAEGWFRNSGLYDLRDKQPYAKPNEERKWHPQVRLMDWFIRKKNVGRGRGGGQIADGYTLAVRHDREPVVTTVLRGSEA